MLVLLNNNTLKKFVSIFINLINKTYCQNKEEKIEYVLFDTLFLLIIFNGRFKNNFRKISEWIYIK
jgi:hypothetical protein